MNVRKEQREREDSLNFTVMQTTVYRQPHNL